MSGTSLDGLDIAFCTFAKAGNSWSYELIGSRHVAYSEPRVDELREAIIWPSVRLFEFDYEYGTWLGQQVDDFIKSENYKADIIASHGHTIHHQPEMRFTHQIGSGQAIARITGITTIADFRSKDVVYGGQGAPLVPIGDQLLFGEYDYCLNLGGIANVSFEYKDQRVAYDIGPANMLLNYLAGQAGLAYDAEGAMAKRGQVIPDLLNELNKLEYYSKPYPKSLGLEWFLSDLKPLIAEASGSLEDKMATAIQHEAEQIGRAILSHPTGNKGQKMLVTGGGARNTALVEAIQKELIGKVKVEVPNQLLIDFKEAIVFAFMGVLRYRNEPNCLASVTGASKDVSGGVIFLP